MEVILKQDVDKVGKAGSVAKVKDGFAHNFLIPSGFAIPVTCANLKKLEQERQIRSKQEQKAKKDAEEIGAGLSGKSVTMSVLAQEQDLLYGSITSQDIAAALKDEGFIIDKSAIILAEPLKALGIYEVPVRLHPEVSVNIKVWIVKK